MHHSELAQQEDEGNMHVNFHSGSVAQWPQLSIMGGCRSSEANRGLPCAPTFGLGTEKRLKEGLGARSHVDKCRQASLLGQPPTMRAVATASRCHPVEIQIHILFLSLRCKLGAQA